MSKKFVKIVQIYKMADPPSNKCQYCNEKATHCIIMPDKVIGWCSKKDCFFHLTQN